MQSFDHFRPIDIQSSFVLFYLSCFDVTFATPLPDHGQDVFTFWDFVLMDDSEVFVR